MSIRLDWEIESDRKHIRGAGEDPNLRRNRRRRYVRMVLTALFGVLLIAAVVFIINSRLRQIDYEIERDLRDTVQSEIAAIRIGDWATFSRVQRSASEQWLLTQRVLFDDYQELIRKDSSVQLSGTIQDVVIEDPRARVQVQEIIGGVPYTRMWFYFRYEDDVDDDGIADNWGWYHVPPDTEFWGAGQIIEGNRFTVEFFEVDRTYAQQAADHLENWLAIACDVMLCPADLHIRVHVSPDGPADIEWSPTDRWQLVMRSPLVDAARTDLPFDPERQVTTANLLAERLTAIGGGGTMVVGSDADYLVNHAVVPWLVGQFVKINTGVFLIDSLVNAYGPQVVGQLVAVIQPDSTISVLTQVIGEPLDQITADWRDFFSWRLNLEQELIAQSNLNAVMMLYDTSDDAAIQQAVRQAGSGAIPDRLIVTHIQPVEPSSDGRPQLLATVRVGEEIDAPEFGAWFRLQENVWKRVA